VVEFQPSKLAVVGSNPIARSSEEHEALGVKREKLEKQSGSCGFGVSFHDSRFTGRDAHVAQLVEHVLGKDEVTRSIRVVGSNGSITG
jgi:hypothetical protein